MRGFCKEALQFVVSSMVEIVAESDKLKLIGHA